MAQANPQVIEASASSIRHSPDAIGDLAELLLAAKAAAKKREEGMIRKVVLPQLSKEIGRDFTVTLRRMTMQDLAMIGDVPISAREYVDTYIEQMNAASMRYSLSRGEEDLSDEELKRVNQELVADVQNRVVEELTGTIYEQKKREMADQYCLHAVIMPDIVEDEDDIDDPSTQIALSVIPLADRIFIQNESGRAEDEAVATDLKSVPAGPDDEANASGEDTGAANGAAAGADPEAGGSKLHPSEPTGTDRAPEQRAGVRLSLLEGDVTLRRDGEGVRGRVGDAATGEGEIVQRGEEAYP